MGGHEGRILGHVFWDLGLALGPVVEAGEIPDEWRILSRLCGAIKGEVGGFPGFVGDHGALEGVPLEVQMALRFRIVRGRVIHGEPFLVGTQVQILALEFQRAVGIAQDKGPLHPE